MSTIILVLTLGMTILPITGKLWSIKESKLKIFWKGWTFIAFSVFALILGAIQINKESKLQSSRDSNQENTLNNTEKIITNLDSSMDKIELKLFRIDSLNIKLGSLEDKTTASIKERNNILNDFNELNKKLEKLYIQEETKIRENIPVVNILDNVKYIKDKGTYKIEVMLSNSGERVAKNLNIEVWFFTTDIKGNIINHKLLSDDLLGGDDLPPTKSTNKKIRYGFPNYPKISPKDSLTSGYLLVNFNYIDFILDTTIYKSEKYIWRRFDLDDLNWISMPKSYSEKLKKYLIEYNIK